MNDNTNNEVVLSKMDKEEKTGNFAASTWTKKESKQIILYFILAFVLLFVFGFLVNHYIL